MILPRSLQADSVRFFVPLRDAGRLSTLPWNLPLEEWDRAKVRLISVKSGLSRHIVRFPEIEGRRYAVKETSGENARREFRRYRELRKRGLPTLEPIGIVLRDEGVALVDTGVARLRQQRDTGYLVTRLMENVLPDSYLFRRAFTEENRVAIWDTVIHLFVRLHTEGVYWGDASLANMLVHFGSEIVPGLGRRKRLEAVLADAETVEIRPSLTASLRMADLEFFLESMLWVDADLRASGMVRDPVVTKRDQKYIRTTYLERFELAQEMRTFELVTSIDVDTRLGSFDVKGYSHLLLKHIQEHRWYLGERRKRDVPLAEAAQDWYQTIFRPVCKIFSEEGLLEFFPDATAASMYVRIMEHKYFMSERVRKDVGLAAALEDYVRRFAQHGRWQLVVRSIVHALASLFGGEEETSSTTALS